MKKPMDNMAKLPKGVRMIDGEICVNLYETDHYALANTDFMLGLFQAGMAMADNKKDFLNQEIRFILDKRMLTDKDFVRHIILSTLTACAVLSKDHAYVSKLYKYLNLFSNEELSKLRHDREGVLFLVDDKRVAVSPAELIYYDVCSAAADRYIKTHDDELFHFIYDYCCEHKEVWSNVLEKYMDGFKALHYTYNNDEVEPGDSKKITNAYLSYIINTGFDENSGNYLKPMVENDYKIVNLDQDKNYKKLISLVEKQICNETKCRNFDKFVESVRKSFLFLDENDSEEANPIMIELSDLFMAACDPHHLHVSLFKNSAPDINYFYVHKFLKCVINSELVEQYHRNGISDITKVNIENVKTIIYRLGFMIYSDLYSFAFSDLLEAYYSVFSFDRIDNESTIREISKKLYKVQDDYDAVKSQYEKLKAKYDSLDKRYRAKAKDENRVYESNIRALEKSNDRLSDENTELKKRIQSYEDYLAAINTNEEADEGEIDEFALATHKFLILGGRTEVINDLRGKLPSAVFTNNETDNVNVDNIDCIVMFTKFMGHKLYYKYISYAREYGVKVIYVASTNTERILKHISKKLNEN